jgi:hypothetical protein
MIIRGIARALLAGNDAVFLAKLCLLIVAVNGALFLLAVAISAFLSPPAENPFRNGKSNAVGSVWRSNTKWLGEKTLAQIAFQLGLSVPGYILLSLDRSFYIVGRFYVVFVNIVFMIGMFRDNLRRMTKKPDDGAVLTQLLNKWRSEGLLAPPHLKTAWSQRGGVQVGISNLRSLRVCWPFGGLSATAESIKISYLFGQIILRRADLERIEHIQGLFESEGLRFKHLRHDIPPLVVFWPMNARNLALKLAQLGFEDYLAPGT